MKMLILMIAMFTANFSYAHEADEAIVRKFVESKLVVRDVYTQKLIEISSSTIDLSTLKCGFSLVYGNVCEAKFTTSYQCEIGNTSIGFLIEENAVNDMMIFDKLTSCK